MIISESTQTDKRPKLEDFRKQSVGLNEKVSFLDGSLKRHINTEDVMLTLLGGCCIII
jgi:hypothetical protein